MEAKFKKRYFRLKKYYFGYNKGNIISNSEDEPKLYNAHHYAQFKRISYTSIFEATILNNPKIFEEYFID